MRSVSIKIASSVLPAKRLWRKYSPLVGQLYNSSHNRTPKQTYLECRALMPLHAPHCKAVARLVPRFTLVSVRELTLHSGCGLYDMPALRLAYVTSTPRRCAVGARVELEELAMKALVYKIADGHTIDDLTEEVCYGGAVDQWGSVVARLQN